MNERSDTCSHVLSAKDQSDWLMNDIYSQHPESTCKYMYIERLHVIGENDQIQW